MHARFQLKYLKGRDERGGLGVGTIVLKLFSQKSAVYWIQLVAQIAPSRVLCIYGNKTSRFITARNLINNKCTN
jgi:hypothetical protein